MLALYRAIAHYKRMIVWAETQPEDALVYAYKMRQSIGEIWFGDDCSLCRKYQGKCARCVIGKLSGVGCVGTPWFYVNVASRWGQWCKEAREELVFLHSLNTPRAQLRRLLARLHA